MKRYQHTFRVTKPQEAVAAFHRDPNMLTGLTPPPLKVTPNNLQPVSEGSIADFNLSFGPISVQWVASHSEVDFPNGFSDTQVKGPFDHWHHRHTFIAVEDQITEIIDTIEAQPASSGINWLISHFMWLNTPILFAYRAYKTRKALNA